MNAEHDKANCYVCRRAWSGLASWRTIAAAAFSGLAISILCATLGAAVGVTTSVETEQPANRLAIESGVGTGIWMFVTAIVVGVVAGLILLRGDQEFRPWRPCASAFVTWAVGISLAAFIASQGSGALAALGAVPMGMQPERALPGEVAAPVSALEPRQDVDVPLRLVSQVVGEPRNLPSAQEVGEALAVAAWLAVCAQIVGLVTTIMVVYRGRHHAHAQTAF